MFFFIAKGIIDIITESGHSVSPLGRSVSSTSQQYLLNDSYKFGIIENESQPFCKDCDRLRLGSDHKLYGCITAKQGIKLSDTLTQDTIQQALHKAMAQKQEVFVGSDTAMITIGG